MSPFREQEPQKEQLLTEESILSAFGQLIGETKFTERRKLSDEQGIYIWEIVIPDGDGTKEFQFMRSGTYPNGATSVRTEIYTNYYDKDGEIIPGGTNVAVF